MFMCSYVCVNNTHIATDLFEACKVSDYILHRHAHSESEHINHINKQVRSSGLIVTIIRNGNCENNNNKRATPGSCVHLM